MRMTSQISEQTLLLTWHVPGYVLDSQSSHRSSHTAVIQHSRQINTNNLEKHVYIRGSNVSVCCSQVSVSSKTISCQTVKRNSIKHMLFRRSTCVEDNLTNAERLMWQAIMLCSIKNEWGSCTSHLKPTINSLYWQWRPRAAEVPCQPTLFLLLLNGLENKQCQENYLLNQALLKDQQPYNYTKNITTMIITKIDSAIWKMVVIVKRYALMGQNGKFWGG